MKQEITKSISYINGEKFETYFLWDGFGRWTIIDSMKAVSYEISINQIQIIK